MFCYKLTTQDMKTRAGKSNEVIWEIGKKVTATGTEEKLCSDGVIHSYRSPLLAVLLNSTHANIPNPKLFLAQGTKILDQDATKACHKSLTLIKELELPVISTNQRVAFAILAAKEVCKDKAWLEWADSWLIGKNRSATAANATAANANANATATAAYANAAAAYAANAAYAAAYAAAAYAANAANANAIAANAAAATAANAANAIAYTAYAIAYTAAVAGKPLCLLALAKQAMKY